MKLGEAIGFSFLLGIFLGLFYCGIRIFCMLCQAGAPVKPMGVPETVELPVLGKVSFWSSVSGGRKIYRNVIYFVTDLLFFLTSGVAVALFIYSVGGVFRTAYIAGVLLGFFFCQCTGNRFLLSAAAYILFGLRVFFLYFRWLLLWPIRKFQPQLRLFGKKILLIFRKLYGTIRMKVFLLRNHRQQKREKEKWERAVTALSVSHLFPEPSYASRKKI